MLSKTVLVVGAILGLVVCIVILLQAGCALPREGGMENLVITDRTGREWDITHARDVYGMEPHYFNYGLGLGAIRSVDVPTVLKEGDSGYPDPGSNIQVFGVNHNGEQRAYSVGALNRHEVFNDVYPGESNQYLAITY